MREGHPTEQAYGVDYHASETDGVGGHLRDAPEDFRVREIESLDLEPLDADPDVYEHLVVRATLQDWETNGFVRELSDRLRISRERVSWAGTKDKRAVTTQLFSISGVDPDALPPIPDAEIEPVGRLGRRLLFGDLAGNAFEIRVADATHPERAGAIADELRAFGGLDGDGGAGEAGDVIAVPNYFGAQRFGSIRPVTHAVGLRIVRRDWKGAVMTYVGDPHEAEPEDTREARRYVEETEDWTGALERMPGHLRYERAILHALAGSGEEPADFRAAIEALPTNLQRLFVNAAQSFVFNRVLSVRLERDLPFHRAVPGDVVCFADEVGDLVVPDTDRTQRVTAGRVETVNRHLDRGRAFVTAPLVGTETVLGEGTPGEIERAVLADLDLAPADFDLPGEFGSTGTRRAILVRTALDITTDPLAFAFSLPKGSYATVVLREFLKSSPRDLG